MGRCLQIREVDGLRGAPSLFVSGGSEKDSVEIGRRSGESSANFIWRRSRQVFWFPEIEDLLAERNMKVSSLAISLENPVSSKTPLILVKWIKFLSTFFISPPFLNYVENTHHKALFLELRYDSQQRQMEPLPLCVLLWMCGMLSRVQLLETLWTVARQASLSMGFSRQEYWSRLPCPTPGDLSDPGIKPVSLVSHALAGWFFTTLPPVSCLYVHGTKWKPWESRKPQHMALLWRTGALWVAG